MSNNLIRKGLAFVATASLALAGVVGISSPANAAPSSLVIESSFGATSAIQASKTQNGVLGYEFNLYVQAPGVAETDEVLYLVESADIAEASVTVNSRWVPTLATASATSDSDTVYRTSGDAVGGQVSHTIRAAASTNGLVIQPSYTTARLSELHQLTINLSATYGATKTVTITPFVDSVDNDQIDSAELKGTPIVITLHKASEVTFASQLVAPTTSSQTLRADVTANKDVNIAQWRTVSSSPVRNQFYVNGTNQGGTDLLVAWSGDVARADSSTVSVPTGAVVSVQQAIAGSATYAASGTTSTISAGNVATISAIGHAGGFSDANAGTSNIRLGDGNVSVDATVTVKSGASESGQTVTFKIEENAVNSIAAAAAVTAGGKSLTNSSATTSQSITVDVLTDADGVATLPISYTGLVDTNAFKITASAVGVGGGVISSATVVKTAIASAATSIIDVAKISTTAVRSIVAGGNVSIAYRIVDQFGQVPVGTYRAIIGETSVTGSNNAVYSATVPVVNGAFTVSFTDNTTGSAAISSAYSVDVTIEKQQTDLSYGATGGIAKNSESVIAVRSAAQAAATLTLAADNTISVARDAVALTTVDKRVAKESVLASAATNGADLSGTALGSNGSLQAGVPVTITAPGLLFEQNGFWSVGTITVHTSADGAWGGVQVFSNKTGNQTITATSGSATKTLVVEFAGTAYADADAISISAPKSIKNGRTLTMTVALVDEFGNGVSSDISRLKVTYSGPGFEIRDPAVAELAAKTGIYTIRVLLGAGDTGVAAVTASFNADTIATGAAIDTITASAATWVGPIANAKAGAKAGRVIVEAYRAKGKTVSVFVGSTRVASFTSNKADFSKVVRGIKSGTRNVSVRLSGPGEDFTGAITVK